MWRILIVVLLGWRLLFGPGGPWAPKEEAAQGPGKAEVADTRPVPKTFDEPPTDPWMPWSAETRGTGVAHCGAWVRDDAPQYRSIQVNSDHRGCNIVGDRANEPSIAIDRTDPRRIVIGWRQFDNVGYLDRQAGWAYSHDAGHTWMFTGSIDPGVFHSDPVLDVDADGNFYFLGLREDIDSCDLFKSIDGGVSWMPGIFNWSNDKSWMAIDRTESTGRGNIYTCGTGAPLMRSTDGGLTFDISPDVTPAWGTLTVGLDGTLYAAGENGWFHRSTNARDPDVIPVFDFSTVVDLGGYLVACQGSNPLGLLGQVWVVVDHSNGPTRDNLYLLSSVKPPEGDPLEVMFMSSEDGGLTWSAPLRVNDDPEGNDAWQWFGMMSIAPNGRIDAVWNDTRECPDQRDANLSELYYSYSTDAGVTWSQNIPLSPVFDSYIGPYYGWTKLGDYYHMISDNLGVNVAYAATFNGEQDVYFLRIGPWDCNGNEVPDECDLDCNSPACEPPVCESGEACIGSAEYTGIADYLVKPACGLSLDCNANDVPDECEYRGDVDGDGLTTLRDFAAFQRCFTGDAAAITDPCCRLFDLNEDDAITLADLPAFQRVLAGP